MAYVQIGLPVIVLILWASSSLAVPIHNKGDTLADGAARGNAEMALVGSEPVVSPDASEPAMLDMNTMLLANYARSGEPGLPPELPEKMSLGPLDPTADPQQDTAAAVDNPQDISPSELQRMASLLRQFPKLKQMVKAGENITAADTALVDPLTADQPAEEGQDPGLVQQANDTKTRTPETDQSLVPTDSPQATDAATRIGQPRPELSSQAILKTRSAGTGYQAPTGSRQGNVSAPDARSSSPGSSVSNTGGTTGTPLPAESARANNGSVSVSNVALTWETHVQDKPLTIAASNEVTPPQPTQQTSPSSQPKMPSGTTLSLLPTGSSLSQEAAARTDKEHQEQLSVKTTKESESAGTVYQAPKGSPQKNMSVPALTNGPSMSDTVRTTGAPLPTESTHIDVGDVSVSNVELTWETHVQDKPVTIVASSEQTPTPPTQQQTSPPSMAKLPSVLSLSDPVQLPQPPLTQATDALPTEGGNAGPGKVTRASQPRPLQHRVDDPLVQVTATLGPVTTASATESSPKVTPTTEIPPSGAPSVTEHDAVTLPDLPPGLADLQDHQFDPQIGKGGTVAEERPSVAVPAEQPVAVDRTQAEQTANNTTEAEAEATEAEAEAAEAEGEREEEESKAPEDWEPGNGHRRLFKSLAPLHKAVAEFVAPFLPQRGQLRKKLSDVPDFQKILLKKLNLHPPARDLDSDNDTNTTEDASETTSPMDQQLPSAASEETVGSIDLSQPFPQLVSLGQSPNAAQPSSQGHALSVSAQGHAGGASLGQSIAAFFTQLLLHPQVQQAMKQAMLPDSGDSPAQEPMPAFYRNLLSNGKLVGNPLKTAPNLGSATSYKFFPDSKRFRQYPQNAKRRRAQATRMALKRLLGSVSSEGGPDKLGHRGIGHQTFQMSDPADSVDPYPRSIYHDLRHSVFNIPARRTYNSKWRFSNLPVLNRLFAAVPVHRVSNFDRTPQMSDRVGTMMLNRFGDGSRASQSSLQQQLQVPGQGVVHQRTVHANAAANSLQHGTLASGLLPHGTAADRSVDSAVRKAQDAVDNLQLDSGEVMVQDAVDAATNDIPLPALT